MTGSTSSSSLLALTGAAVVMEVGLLVASLSAGESPATTGVVLGAFHVGYLFADRVARWSPPHIRVGTIIGALAVPALLLPFGALASSPAVLVMATGIQALRRQLKRASKPPVAVKNLVKFAAMVVGGIAAWVVGFGALGVATAASVAMARGGCAVAASATPHPPPLSRRLQRVLRATEFAHHAHYFIYCYTFWRLDDALDARLVGPVFTVGWFAYFAAEGLIGRRLHFSPIIMSAGHVFCALCLGGMLMSSNLGWLLAMWFLTGVGGGTAYMLGNGPQAVGRERAEDWGHVAGTVFGGVIATWAVSLSIAIAGIVALIAALFSFSLQTLISRQQEGQISAPR
jgi:hypothetical protein